MAGPNFVLDKGFYVKSNQTGISFGLCATLDSASTGDRVVKSVAGLADGTTSGATRTIGIFQETLDDAKVATGKAAVNVRMLGISRAVSGAAIDAGTLVKSDAAGKLIEAAGLAGANAVGIALTTAGGANVWIDVLLTPGAVGTA